MARIPLAQPHPNGDAAAQALSIHNTSITLRAPRQHAHIAEKRTDLLKQQLKGVGSQLLIEGMGLLLYTAPSSEMPSASSSDQSVVGISAQRRLAVAVLAGNLLLSINGGTLYQALYGRTSHVFPHVDLSCVQADDSGEGLPIAVRHAHRLRELTVQAIVEGTTKARIERAMNSRTRPAGEEADYRIGNQVEFYSSPGSKDVTDGEAPQRCRA